MSLKDEYLDVVGGQDDTKELSTAERYNPTTDQWSPVVAMNSRRSGVRFIKKIKIVLLILFISSLV